MRKKLQCLNTRIPALGNKCCTCLMRKKLQCLNTRIPALGSKESVVHRQTRKKMQCQNKKAATERKEKRVISNYN